MTIEGYLLRFDEPGYNGEHFAKDCKYTSVFSWIPVVNKHADYGLIHGEHDAFGVGYAYVQNDGIGLYAICEINKQNLQLPPSDIRGLNFSAHNIRKNESGEIESMVFRYIALSRLDHATRPVKIRDKETSGADNKKEFMVAYAPNWCNVAAVETDDGKKLKLEYQYALVKFKLKYGERVAWNNQILRAVTAKNSYAALDTFMNDLKKELCGDRSELDRILEKNKN